MLGRSRISCSSKWRPSSSQPTKQTHNLQWVLLGGDLMISPTCEVGGRRFDSRKDQLPKGLDCRVIPLRGLSSQLQCPRAGWQPTVCVCVSRARFVHAVGKIGLLQGISSISHTCEVWVSGLVPGRINNRLGKDCEIYILWYYISDLHRIQLFADIHEFF